MGSGSVIGGRCGVGLGGSGGGISGEGVGGFTGSGVGAGVGASLSLSICLVISGVSRNAVNTTALWLQYCADITNSA